jgi:2,3,4,5-tetrahydropyridine-2-carboxylate N-succinyltransferase
METWEGILWNNHDKMELEKTMLLRELYQPRSIRSLWRLHSSGVIMMPAMLTLVLADEGTMVDNSNSRELRPNWCKTYIERCWYWWRSGALRAPVITRQPVVLVIVVEGVHAGKEAVLGANVHLSHASTKNH